MAAKINIDNYEALLLDYMEGNLNKEDALLLQQFVVLHPELNIDLNELELVELTEEGFVFENKNELKKSAAALISEEQFVNYIENNLASDEKIRLEQLAATHPELNKELTLYKKTILKADTSILFDNKNALKKETKIIWLFSRQTLAMAASILLVFGIWMVFKFYNPVNSSSEVSSTLPKNEIKIEGNKEAFSSVTPITNMPEDKAISNKSDQNLTASSIAKKQKTNKTIVSNTIAVIQANPIVENMIAENNIATTNTLVTIETKAVSNEIKPTRAYIITEKSFDEDEKVLAANNTKKGFWSKAKKALSGLNQIGLKAVNGTENNISNSDQVVLSLGNFSVENKKYNQE